MIKLFKPLINKQRVKGNTANGKSCGKTLQSSVKSIKMMVLIKRRRLLSLLLILRIIHGKKSKYKGCSAMIR